MPDASHAILPNSRDSELRRRAHAVIPGGLWGHLNADRLPEGYPAVLRHAPRAAT